MQRVNGFGGGTEEDRDLSIVVIAIDEGGGADGRDRRRDGLVEIDRQTLCCVQSGSEDLGQCCMTLVWGSSAWETGKRKESAKSSSHSFIHSSIH